MGFYLNKGLNRFHTKMSALSTRAVAATCRQLFFTQQASRGAHVHFPGTVKNTIKDHKKEYAKTAMKGDNKTAGGGELISEENKAEMMQVQDLTALCWPVSPRSTSLPGRSGCSAPLRTQCKAECLTPRNGRLNLTPASAGKTPPWAGAPTPTRCLISPPPCHSIQRPKPWSLSRGRAGPVSLMRSLRKGWDPSRTERISPGTSVCAEL